MTGLIVRRASGGVLLAALTVLTWWVWLGSDTTYQIDPDTGLASGPYEAPQVVACAVTLFALAAAAAWVLPVPAVVAVETVAFTVAWSVPASSDSTGLWAIGAFMVLGGVTAWTVLGALAGAAAHRRRAAARS